MFKKLALLALAIIMILPVSFVIAQDNTCTSFASGSNTERTSYYMGEGAAFMRSGNYSAAIRAYSCIIEEIDAGYADAWYNRAAAYFARREFDLALEDYNQVISLDSGNAEAYNNRGIVYAAQGEYELALADFSSALSNDSDYINAIINRGVISAIMGDYDAAEADFRQVIEIEDLDAVIAELQDPEREDDAPVPEYNRDAIIAYALIGIIESQRAVETIDNYLYLAGGRADSRIQSAAGALESRFEFELRFDDGSWFLLANLADS